MIKHNAGAEEVSQEVGYALCAAKDVFTKPSIPAYYK